MHGDGLELALVFLLAAVVAVPVQATGAPTCSRVNSAVN